MKKSEIETLRVLKNIEGSYIESAFSDIKRINDPYNRCIKKIVKKTFNSLLSQGFIDGKFPRFNITELGKKSV